MCAPVLFAATLSLAAEVWVAPATERVFPDSPRSSAHEISLHLAAGEYESFQIVVQNDSESKEPLSILLSSKSESPLPPPQIYEVRYVRTSPPSKRAAGHAPLWPDVLRPYDPRPLQPNERRTFWLTYYARPDTAPGLFESSLRITAGEERIGEIDVSFEVFGFVLPRASSLKAMHTLTRRPIRLAYRYEAESIQQWQRVYDAFSDYRIAIRVWDGGPLVEPSEPDFLTQHVAYASTVAHMDLVEIASVENLLRLFPASDGDEALQTFLRGFDGPTAVRTTALGNRAAWPDLLAENHRLDRIAPAVRRITIAPLHPFWQDTAEIWAIPLETYDFNARRLFDSGRSLAFAQSTRAANVLASSAIEGSAPEDAYDGSLFSVWSPAPSDQAPAVDVQLESLLNAQSLNIAWTPGASPQALRFATSRDGRSFTPATVSWTIDEGQSPGQYTWWDGELRVAKSFNAFRIELNSTQPVRLHEISFESGPHYPYLERDRPVVPWLHFDASAFPSLEIDAPVADFRIRPWLCWAYDVTGYTAGAITNWPLQWYGAASVPPDFWPPGTAAETLVYPDPAGPIPSIRLMHQRDGLEDYEYLRSLASLLESIERNPQTEWLHRLAVRNSNLARVATENPDETIQALLRDRVLIGQAITALKSGRIPADPSGFAR